MILVYSKETVSKKAFDYNIPMEEVEISLNGNVFIDHPELDPNNYVVIERDTPFEYPTFKNGTIEEMSLYERYQNGLYALSYNEKEYKGSIITLEQGQYIDKNELVTIPKPTGFKIEWNFESNIWEEKASKEEIKEEYFNRINKFKSEILQVGFDFNGHQQKCREKDLALLGNAIAANEDAQPFATVPVTHWSFNDGDVVEMSLDELKKLRVNGATFVQAIFTVEAICKHKEPNMLFTKENFIEEINKISEIKCFEDVL